MASMPALLETFMSRSELVPERIGSLSDSTFKMVSFADGFGTAQLQTVKVGGDLKLFHAEV